MATSVSEDDERFCDRGHAPALLTGLDRLRTDGQFCDVELRLGPARHRAHRAVLAACSPYFFSGLV